MGHACVRPGPVCTQFGYDCSLVLYFDCPEEVLEARLLARNQVGSSVFSLVARDKWGKRIARGQVELLGQQEVTICN